MTKQKTEGQPVKLWVMVIALGFLVVVSGIQAFELADLKEQVDTELSGLTAQSSSGSTGSAGSSGTTLQNNLKSLPTMVGGC